MSLESGQQWLLDLKTVIQKPDLLLHLGYGNFPDLDAYEALNPGRIAIFDPCHETLVELRTATQRLKNLEIIPVAANLENGEVNLIHCNLPQFNSLRPISPELSDEFGIEMLGSTPVQGIKVTELLEMAEVRDSACNWLVIETTGMEAALLEAMISEDKLKLFSRILLRMSEKPSFTEKHPTEDLISTLADNHFNVDRSKSCQKPGWSYYQFLNNPDSRQCEKLDAALKKRTEEHEELRLKYEQAIKQTEEQNQLVRNLRDQHAKEVNSLNTSIADIGTEKSDLETQVQAHKQTIQDLRDQHAREVDALNTNITTFGTERADLETQVQAHQQTIDDLHKKYTVDIEKLNRTISDLEGEKQKSDDYVKLLKENLQELEAKHDKQLKELSDRNDEMKSDLSVALRLQALRETDLRDLQSQFTENLEIRQRQERLLIKLKQRLETASKYLQQISIQSDSTLQNELASSLVKALSGDVDDY